MSFLRALVGKVSSPPTGGAGCAVVAIALVVTPVILVVAAVKGLA